MALAKIKGSFLKPTISANGRKYTTENISKGVARMQDRLTSGSPITMFCGHDAAVMAVRGPDATDVVGRITKVDIQPNGLATYEGEIADTTKGRDIVALVKGGFAPGVSIRGKWMSTPYESDGAVTADDMDVVGIDFAPTPGIAGMGVDDIKLSEATAALAVEGIFLESAEPAEFSEMVVEPDTESATMAPYGRMAELFSEAAELFENAAMVVEAGNAPGDGKKPYGNVTYADPGYQKDKKKRYPIDTAAHVRAAWAYINKAKNAGAYTSAQLSAIKGKIKKAAGKFKIDIEGESEILISDIRDVLEAYVSICVDSGTGSVSVSGSEPDPKLIDQLASRIAYAALAGIHVLDPDMDGDVDLSPPTGAEAAPDDNNMDGSTTSTMGTILCPVCKTTVPNNEFMFCPTCGTAVPGAESISPGSEDLTSQEATVSDTETTNTEAAVAPPALSEESKAAMAAAVTEGVLAAFAAQREAEKIEADTAAWNKAVADQEAATAAALAGAESAPTESAPAGLPQTVEELNAMLAQVAESAATKATETVKAAAVQQFEQSGGWRKGVIEEHVASILEGGGSLDPKELSEMDETTLLRASQTAFEHNAFFGGLMAKADHRAGRSNV